MGYIPVIVVLSLMVVFCFTSSHGQSACVAGGGTPHQIDILIINNTEYDLELDKSEISPDGCQGIEVNAGKIVKGAEPPLVVKKMSKARFSASGREASAVAPNGRVFYHNKQENLHLISVKADVDSWTYTVKEA